MSYLRITILWIGVGGLGAIAHLLPILFSQSLIKPSILVAYLALGSTVIFMSACYFLWAKSHTWYGATGAGLLIGLGYFGLSLHWVGESVVPDPATYSIQAALTALGGWTLLYPWWAAFFGFSYLLTSILRIDRASPNGAILYALCFSIADVLLGDLAFRIPLAPIGASTLDTAWQQLLTVVGIHGTSTLIAATGALLGVVALSGARKGFYSLIALLCCLTVVATISTENKDHILTASTHPDTGRVYLAQPNPPTSRSLGAITDSQKIELDGVINSIEAGRGADLIVLPESALRRDLSAEPDIVRELSSHLQPGASLVIGFPRVEVTTGTNGSFTVNAYNTAYIITSNGDISGSYDKTHLAPFGEYMPQIFYRMGFNVIAGPATGLNAGQNLDVFQVPGFTPFSLLICYEALLSGPVSRETKGADWLLNISSEGLFGKTIGPRLLLHYARLRAAESGLPMLRSASTGFTAVIDGRGDILQALDGQITGGIFSHVPQSHSTIFRVLGYLPLYISWLIAFALITTLTLLKYLKYKNAAHLHRQSILGN